MKLIMQSSPASHNLVFLKPKYIPQQPVLTHAQFMSS